MHACSVAYKVLDVKMDPDKCTVFYWWTSWHRDDFIYLSLYVPSIYLITQAHLNNSKYIWYGCTEVWDYDVKVFVRAVSAILLGHAAHQDIANLTRFKKSCTIADDAKQVVPDLKNNWVNWVKESMEWRCCRRRKNDMGRSFTHIKTSFILHFSKCALPIHSSLYPPSSQKVPTQTTNTLGQFRVRVRFLVSNWLQHACLWTIVVNLIQLFASFRRGGGSLVNSWSKYRRKLAGSKLKWIWMTCIVGLCAVNLNLTMIFVEGSMQITNRLAAGRIVVLTGHLQCVL